MRAFLIFAVVAFAVALFRLYVPRASAEERPFVVEELTHVPEAWPTFPVVASPGEPTTPKVESEVFSDVRSQMIPLGDIRVYYRYDVCTWGGSACAGAIPSLHHIRFGRVDGGEEPSMTTTYSCSGTAIIAAIPEERRQSCSPASLLLRSPDGVTFVITIRDPDVKEIPIAAFVRARSRTARSVRVPVIGSRLDRGVLVGVDVVLLAVAGFALRALRRSTRLGSWREAAVTNGVLEIPGEASVPLKGLSFPDASNVLVDPAVLPLASSFRSNPAIAEHALVTGSLEEARRRTQVAQRIAFAAVVVSVCFSLIAIFTHA